MQCSQYSTITAFSINGTYSVPNSMQVRNIHNTLWNMSPTFPSKNPCYPAPRTVLFKVLRFGHLLRHLSPAKTLKYTAAFIP